MAAFLGANGKLAFAKGGDIWVAEADGSSPTQLTTDPGLDRSPRWSPDGTQIAFASNRDGDFEIFVMNADGSRQRQLTYNAGPHDRFPAWTADSTQILYDRNFSEIYVANADGSGTERKVVDGFVPATSAHGDRIVFSAGNFDVFTSRLDGTGTRQILDGTVLGGFNASWSPRGNDLVLVAEFADAPPDNDVFLVRANGRRPIQIVDTDNRVEFSPVWAPDESKIAFLGCLAFPSDCRIYVVNPDGSGETEVVAGVDPGTGGVDWQPSPRKAPPPPDPRTGGTAVVGVDQEPACLNFLLVTCNNFAWASWTAGVALPGAFRVTPSFSYEPVLVDGVDISLDPFALTYRIKEHAVWSDGTPISADDFLFTLRTILESDLTRKAGYDLIADAVRVDAKTARFVFTRPFGAWRTLFPTILPKHVLEGYDFDEVWQSEIADPVTHRPIGAGPYLVTRWDQGNSITLSPNPLWWGPQEPFLDTLVIRFILDSNARFQALVAGEVDLLAPQPQFQIADLLQRPEIAVESSPGRSVEHLDFNTGSAAMPLLGERWFRQAVAYALDRSAIVPLLYGSIGVAYGAHESLIFLSGQESYQPSFLPYAYSPATVAEIMQAHGCALGADAIWVCSGIRASVKFATTTGNPLRDLTQQAMQAQARAAGIELVADNSPAGILFGSRLPAGDYELVMFTWLKGDDPGGQGTLYGCGGSQNFMAYCSVDVTDLLAGAESEVDPLARASLLSEADAILAEEVPSLPLFLRPAFLAYQRTLHGPANNPTEEGPLWNVADWWTE